MIPDFEYELSAHEQGLIACGVDEAGRGPWAGPVVAAAVILDKTRIPPGLNDSKKLSEVRRDALFDPIITTSQVGIGIVGAAVIDEINILQATFRAMSEAVAALGSAVQLALVDGNRVPPLSIRVQTIIGGDAKSLSIAAASIVAKVTRDRIMKEADARYPGYDFHRHKGYGTAGHLAALQKRGPCPEHRKSFAPIRGLLAR
jgi:ribonuclease HII